MSYTTAKSTTVTLCPVTSSKLYCPKYFNSKITDGRIIFRWIFRKWDENMDWIDLAQDTARWWALVNVGMNLQVP
jgi:hypothetical protein